MIYKKAMSFLALCGMSTAAYAEAPTVVATIKPIHSLVSAVMQDVAKPTLLIDGADSSWTSVKAFANACYEQC